jgi:hypothetical protein
MCSESARSYSSASYRNRSTLLYTFTFIGSYDFMSNIEYGSVYIIGRGKDLVCHYIVVTLTLHSLAVETSCSKELSSFLIASAFARTYALLGSSLTRRPTHYSVQLLLGKISLETLLLSCVNLHTFIYVLHRKRLSSSSLDYALCMVILSHSNGARLIALN